MLLWRISNYATLDGLGGTLQSARWHTKGKPVIYATDHPSSCLLEMLVNTNFALLPSHFQLIQIDAPDNVLSWDDGKGDAWKDSLLYSREIGDEWLANCATLLFKVPSAILPHVANYLINPNHPRAVDLKIRSVQSVPLDRRFKK